MKYLNTYEKFYQTHNNSDRPFVVNKDEKGRTFLYKQDRLLPEVDKIMSGGKEDDDSLVLLQIDKHNYIFVGYETYEFETPEEIKKYYTPIGNSDVTYPVALSDNYAYFMLDKVYVPIYEFPHNIEWRNAYSYFYKNRFKDIAKPLKIKNVNNKSYESILLEKKDSQPIRIYSEKEIQKRWDKKRNHIKTLSKNIRKLKSRIDHDLSSSDEKTRIIACVAKIMEITGERVGNDNSSEEGRHGISNLQKKHIKIDGDTVTLKYTGKSHVKHEKSFTHPKVASILKELLSRKTSDVFSTSDGISIKAPQVNRYLSQFDITSKDLRGFKSNKLMIQALMKLGKVKEEKDRKKKFNELLRKIADEIGHLPGTLRKHYLLPEIEDNFYSHGSIGRVQKI